MIQCILAFLLCFSCQIQAQKVKNDEVYTLAISYEKSGDAKNAARLYQELYAKDNTNSNFLYGVSRTLQSLQRFPELLPIIEEFTIRFPTIEHFSLCSFIAKKSGFTEKSNTYWEQSLQLVSKLPNDIVKDNAIRLVGKYQTDAQSGNNAILTYKKGKELLKNQLGLYSDELSQLYALIKDYESGTKEVLELFSLNQNYALVQGRLSAYLTTVESIEHIDKQLSKQAELQHSYALYKLYQWFLRETKQYDKALALVKKTEKLFGSKGRDIADFADLCNKDGILDIANEAYSLLIDLGKSSPFYSKAIFGYATVLEQKLNILKKTFPDSIPKDDILYIISKYDDIVQSSPYTAIASECLFRKSQLQSNFLDDNVSAKKTLELIIQGYAHHSISLLAANELALLLIQENNSIEAKKILLHNITKASLDQNEIERSQFILAEMMYFEGNIDSAIVLLLPISGKPESDIANDALERLLFIDENKQYVSDLIIFAKAEHYERMKKYSEALPEFKKITAEGDLSELSQINVAEVYSKLKDVNKAIEEYYRFLTLYPESIRTDKVLYTIGEMNIIQGEKEKAIISFTDILVRYPNSMYVKKSRDIIRKLRGDVH